MAGKGTELGVGYVSIVASTGDLRRDIDKGLKAGFGSADAVGKQAGSKTGRAFGSAFQAAGRVTDSLKRNLVRGAKIAGGAAGLVMGSALKMGFDRLDALDQAQAKFKGLGLTAKTSAAVIRDVTASVKGTAFSTAEAADTAAMSLASGVKPGKELQGVLRTVADAAAFANKSFADVSPVMMKAVSMGKVTGDTLTQLEQNAIPVTQALAKSMKLPAEEIRKLASAGKISFPQLQKALQASIGGTALSAGDTFTGSMRNAKAALARFGEAILAAPFAAAPGIFKKIGDAIDGLTTKVQAIGEYVRSGEITQGFKDAFGSSFETAKRAIDVFMQKWNEFTTGLSGGGGAGTAFGELGGALREFGEALMGVIPPALDVAAALGEAGLGVTVVALTALLKVLAPIISGVLTPALEWLADVLSKNEGAAKALVVAYTGFKFARLIGGFGSLVAAAAPMIATLASVTLGWIAMGIQAMIAGAKAAIAWVIGLGPIAWVIAAIAAVVAALVWFFTQTEIGQELWQGFVDFLSDCWDWIKDVWSEAGDWFGEQWQNISDTATSVWTAITDWVSSAWETIKNGASTAVDWIIERFNSFMSFMGSLPGKIAAIGSSMWNGLKSGLLTVLNWAIDQINRFIGIANKVPGVSIPTISRMADGGLVGKADGGHVRGPGTGTSDSIPTLLSNGEFVINAKSASKIGYGALTALNAFAAGGQVGKVSPEERKRRAEEAKRIREGVKAQDQAAKAADDRTKAARQARNDQITGIGKGIDQGLSMASGLPLADKFTGALSENLGDLIGGLTSASPEAFVAKLAIERGTKALTTALEGGQDIAKEGLGVLGDFFEIPGLDSTGLLDTAADYMPDFTKLSGVNGISQELSAGVSDRQRAQDKAISDEKRRAKEKRHSDAKTQINNVKVSGLSPTEVARKVDLERRKELVRGRR